MKKIIAAALSLIVGVFGYTIVDKKLDERVSNLEYSVSSLADAQSSVQVSSSLVRGEQISIAKCQPYVLDFYHNNNYYKLYIDELKAEVVETNTTATFTSDYFTTGTKINGTTTIRIVCTGHTDESLNGVNIPLHFLDYKNNVMGLYLSDASIEHSLSKCEVNESGKFSCSAEYTFRGYGFYSDISIAAGLFTTTTAPYKTTTNMTTTNPNNTSM